MTTSPKFRTPIRFPISLCLILDIGLFLERWVCDGCLWLKTIHSDQNLNLLYNILTEICEITGVRQATEGYNLRENGTAEGVPGTSTRILRKQAVLSAEWDVVTFAYNSTSHEATGVSPLYILYAFDPHGSLKEVPKKNLS